TGSPRSGSAARSRDAVRPARAVARRPEVRGPRGSHGSGDHRAPHRATRDRSARARARAGPRRTLRRSRSRYGPDPSVRGPLRAPPEAIAPGCNLRRRMDRVRRTGLAGGTIHHGAGAFLPHSSSWSFSERRRYGHYVGYRARGRCLPEHGLLRAQRQARHLRVDPRADQCSDHAPELSPPCGSAGPGLAAGRGDRPGRAAGRGRGSAGGVDVLAPADARPTSGLKRGPPVTGEDHEATLRVLAEGKVDALVVMDVVEDDPRIPALATAPRPVVLLGYPTQAQGIPRVDFDFEQATALAVTELHRRGAHRLVM